jgi:carbohydrate-binding DOMON domain-containing protein
MKLRFPAAFLLLTAMAVSALAADKITLEDPRGDDDGPGGYVYPTDAVYTRGSFDLTSLEVSWDKKNVDFDVTLATKLEDPWGMGGGFAVQMIFVFIDTGDGGNTDTPPGLNVKFADSDAWDYVVILSPQKKSRVTSEVGTKAESMSDAILVPNRTRGKGKTISGSIKLEDLGGGDPASWGYQVVVQSNEGFPQGGDLLTRKVNEYEGQHRFGGGNDGNCDPHVIDCLAGAAKGGDDEVQAQHDMLSFECDDEGNTKSMATLKMIRAK